MPPPDAWARARPAGQSAQGPGPLALTGPAWADWTHRPGVGPAGPSGAGPVRPVRGWSVGSGPGPQQVLIGFPRPGPGPPGPEPRASSPRRLITGPAAAASAQSAGREVQRPKPSPRESWPAAHWPRPSVRPVPAHGQSTTPGPGPTTAGALVRQEAVEPGPWARRPPGRAARAPRAALPQALSRRGCHGDSEGPTRSMPRRQALRLQCHKLYTWPGGPGGGAGGARGRPRRVTWRLLATAR